MRLLFGIIFCVVIFVLLYSIQEEIKNRSKSGNACYHSVQSLLSSSFFFSSCGAAAPRGPWPPHSWGFLITHNDAPQSVGLLWTSDKLVAKTSDSTQHLQQADVHTPGGIQTHNLSLRAAADLRLRRCGHWDRHGPY